MSRLEKIEQLDKEMRETLKICAAEGLSEKQIRSLAAPLAGFHERWNRNERLRKLMILAALVVVVAIFYQSKVTTEFISAVAKIGMVKLVLPYWDWTKLHSRDCLFYNPYRAYDEFTAKDCEPLVGLQSIERAAKITEEAITEDHLFFAEPIIIMDAMTDWKAFKELNFNHEFIRKLYQSDPVLSNASVCNFSGKENTLLELLDNITEIDNFDVHWGHCKLNIAKIFRTFYRRPYFLPGMVEADTRNFLALGKRTDEKKHLPDTAFVPSNMQMTWFSQVKGRFRFKLYPNPICEGMLTVLEGTLNPGEILMYINQMWTLHYSAERPEDSVAIISGGRWD